MRGNAGECDLFNYCSTGIGEDIIKTSKKNLKTKTEAVSEAAEEEDYEAVASNSVYPQCVGSQAHICRLNADPIRE